jgi:hypothetical protein
VNHRTKPAARDCRTECTGLVCTDGVCAAQQGFDSGEPADATLSESDAGDRDSAAFDSGSDARQPVEVNVVGGCTARPGSDRCAAGALAAAVVTMCAARRRRRRGSEHYGQK